MPQFHYESIDSATAAAKRLKRTLARHRLEVGLNRALEGVAHTARFRNWQDMRRAVESGRAAPSPRDARLATAAELHARYRDQEERLAVFFGLPQPPLISSPIACEAALTGNGNGPWRVWTTDGTLGVRWSNRFLLPSLDPKPRLPDGFPRLSLNAQGVQAHGLGVRQRLDAPRLDALVAMPEYQADLTPGPLPPTDEEDAPGYIDAETSCLVLAHGAPVGWITLYREGEDLDVFDFAERDLAPVRARLTYTVKDVYLLPGYRVGERDNAAVNALAGQLAEWLMMDVAAMAGGGLGAASAARARDPHVVEQLEIGVDADDGALPRRVVARMRVMHEAFAEKAGVDEHPVVWL